MRHIDAFCHFFPPRLFERVSRTAGGTKDIGKRMQGVRTIYDLDARLKMMDEFDEYAEILSLGLPPLDAMGGAEQATEFARIANDGLAELCAKYPDRFAGYVGALPMNAPEAAAKEAERILNPRQRQRAAAAHQRQRRVPGRAAVLSDLRDRGKIRKTGAAAPRAHRQCPGLPG